MLNETKLRGIYDDFLTSGLTISDYCATQHMYEAKSFYWQNKLKGQLPPKRGFIPVVFGNEPVSVTSKKFAGGLSKYSCQPNDLL